MPPKPLIPLEDLDLNNVIFNKEKVLKKNPQRYEFEQLDGIIYLDVEKKLIAGFKKQQSSEFWTRGHLPNNPLMPGVLMIEAAAQLGSFYFHNTDLSGPDTFFGFGGVDKVKFRKTVKPGDTLLLLGENIKLRSKMAVFSIQGFVDGDMVFEAEITGRIF